MPSRNIVKQYVEGGYYHIYNRGVEKRDIFLDGQDYEVFISMMAEKLTELASYKNICRKNYSDRIDLLNYCLMPNHFHLQIKQLDDSAMAEFVGSLANSYTLYFNKRHKRVGGLFQGCYKAVLVVTDEQQMHISRYIELNPSKIHRDPFNYKYSSYKYYASGNEPIWLKSDDVLRHFSDREAYKDFARQSITNSKEILGPLCIE